MYFWKSTTYDLYAYKSLLGRGSGWHVYVRSDIIESLCRQTDYVLYAISFS